MPPRNLLQKKSPTNERTPVLLWNVIKTYYIKKQDDAMEEAATREEKTLESTLWVHTEWLQIKQINRLQFFENDNNQAKSL